jgi:hypothetical protein
MANLKNELITNTKHLQLKGLCCIPTHFVEVGGNRGDSLQHVSKGIPWETAFVICLS